MYIVKNPKEYIQEKSPNVQTVTSLAHWLTAEGLNNPLIAAMLKDAIFNSNDDDFKEAFDGATKEEATHFLASWELCYMPLWGAPELSKAILLSDEGRSEALALRAVSMAQSVEELSDLFTPAIGIKWAMDKGYLIENIICTWVGVEGGSYWHPHNQIKSITGGQESAPVEALPILETDNANTNAMNSKVNPWDITDPKDPAPKQPWVTPARYFARQLVKNDSTLLIKRELLAHKTSQSLANAGIYKRGGKKPPMASTILQAFHNITLD